MLGILRIGLSMCTSWWSRPFSVWWEEGVWTCERNAGVWSREHSEGVWSREQNTGVWSRGQGESLTKLKQRLTAFNEEKREGYD